MTAAVAGAVTAVTGASGYIGRHVAERLARAGRPVLNLTGQPERRVPEAWWASVRTELLDFERPNRLTDALRGVDTLYNTWWIRFEHGAATFDRAVDNSRLLIRAAEEAGVRRIVHVSIANPSADSPLPYYRGKAAVEAALAESRLSVAIVRPTVVYGTGDVLINNIAWVLRHAHLFGIPGDGEYPVQPVHAADLAVAMVELGDGDEVVARDAVGPERYSFAELVQIVRWAVRARAVVVRVPPAVALAGARMLGAVVGDVLLTGDELQGLMGGLLASPAPALGSTSFAQWLVHHRNEVGRRYVSELERHYRGRGEGLGPAAAAGAHRSA